MVEIRRLQDAALAPTNRIICRADVLVRRSG